MKVLYRVYHSTRGWQRPLSTTIHRDDCRAMPSWVTEGFTSSGAGRGGATTSVFDINEDEARARIIEGRAKGCMTCATHLLAQVDLC